MKMTVGRCFALVPLVASMSSVVSDACAQMVLVKQSAALTAAILGRDGTILTADNQNWPVGSPGDMSLEARAQSASHAAKVSLKSSLAPNRLTAHMDSLSSYQSADMTQEALSTGSMELFFDVTKTSDATIEYAGFNGGNSVVSPNFYAIGSNGEETLVTGRTLQAGHYVFRGKVKTHFGAWMNRGSSSSQLGAVFDVTMTLTDANPLAHGPYPDDAYFQQEAGPYAVSQGKVNAPVGFGGATLYYPTTTAEGAFGLVVVTPGSLETRTAVSWLGARLASHGFVVATIDTKSIFDSTASRTAQTKAAIAQILALNEDASTGIAGRIDAGRIAAIGHSTGSPIDLARDMPQLRASIALAPFAATRSTSAITVPTMIVSCQRDLVAPVASNANKLYAGLSASLPKALAEIKGASHTCTNTSTSAANKQMVGKYTLSWLKRFVDNDTRYSATLCESPQFDLSVTPTVLSAYKDTCPY